MLTNLNEVKETRETSSSLCPLRQLISLSGRKCFPPVCWRCAPLSVPRGAQKYLRETELKRVSCILMRAQNATDDDGMLVRVFFPYYLSWSQSEAVQRNFEQL